jgi:hypothetical protein
MTAIHRSAPMGRKRLAILLFLFVGLILALSAWSWLRRSPASPPDFPPASATPPPGPTPSPAPGARLENPSDRPAVGPPTRADLAPVPPHPDAVSFGGGHLDPAGEIARLHGFFEHYRRTFGAFPAGQDNAHFMNALRGKNPRGLGIFPLSHPRLNERGEVLDAWGQAFIFHPVSRDHLEIRSAGPDREAYTADDLVEPKRPALSSP